MFTFFSVAKALPLTRLRLAGESSSYTEWLIFKSEMHPSSKYHVASNRSLPNLEEREDAAGEKMEYKIHVRHSTWRIHDGWSSWKFNNKFDLSGVRRAAFQSDVRGVFVNSSFTARYLMCAKNYIQRAINAVARTGIISTSHATYIYVIWEQSWQVLTAYSQNTRPPDVICMKSERQISQMEDKWWFLILTSGFR